MSATATPESLIALIAGYTADIKDATAKVTALKDDTVSDLDIHAGVKAGLVDVHVQVTGEQIVALVVTVVGTVIAVSGSLISLKCWFSIQSFV